MVIEVPLGEAAAPGTSVLKRHPSTAADLVPAWLCPVSIGLSRYRTAVPAETSALPRGAPDGPNTFSPWRLLSALCPCPAALAGTSSDPVTGGWAAAPSPLLLSPDAPLCPEHDLLPLLLQFFDSAPCTPLLFSAQD